MKDKPIYIHNSRFKPAISEERILGVIKDMADEINRDLGDKKPLFLSVLNGAFLFTADLIKHFNNECEISFVKMASYSGTESGQLKSLIGLTEDVAGRNIVILEDIIDSGHTLSKVMEILQTRNPNSIELCTLVSKPSRREIDLVVKFLGFEVEDRFIVGYGLDFDQKYRHLPFIGEIGL